MTQCLLGGPTLLSNFVDEGDRLSDIGLDVLEFALVAEDLSGVKASGDKREAFLFTVGLKLWSVKVKDDEFVKEDMY